MLVLARDEIRTLYDIVGQTSYLTDALNLREKLGKDKYHICSAHRKVDDVKYHVYQKNHSASNRLISSHEDLGKAIVMYDKLGPGHIIESTGRGYALSEWIYKVYSTSTKIFNIPVIWIVDEKFQSEIAKLFKHLRLMTDENPTPGQFSVKVGERVICYTTTRVEAEQISNIIDGSTIYTTSGCQLL